MNIGRQLMYHQKSIPVSELVNGQSSFTLQFGGNIQTTGATLEVDSGMTERFGKVLPYNARFHFYGSTAITDVGKPDTGGAIDSDADNEYYVFVRYDDGKGVEKLLYLGSVFVPQTIHFATIPTLYAKELLVVIGAGQSSYYVKTYPLTASSRYNYSYYAGPAVERVVVYDTDPLYSELHSLILADNPNRLVVRKENNAINVTEQYNPFVFRVEHSYLAPGNVTDVQPQLVAVTDVSYGDYPLNVFTDRGVYALLQGNGTILYSAFRSVSNLVSEKNSISTESGTFFIAAGGLWLVAGNHAVLVSDALSLGPHKYIRGCLQYQQLCNSQSTYGIGDALSDPIFEVFLQGAWLSYNRFRDEIIVSSADYEYSYVLSLKYRQWFKIARALEQDTAGSSLARDTWSGDTLIDMSNETEGASILVHLQSRPFSFGYQYSHIHRIVSMLRVNLASSSYKIVVALFGSDDLQGWTLLNYAFRKGPERFSQVRTAPAARSWRYYTVTIGGFVPEDADFGPVLIDYEPVIRRIG